MKHKSGSRMECGEPKGKHVDRLPDALYGGAANISASSRLLNTPPSPLLQSNLPVEAFVNRVRIVAHAALENDLRLFDYRDVFAEVAIE
jgi:hypothetical protein